MQVNKVCKNTPTIFRSTLRIVAKGGLSYERRNYEL